MPERYGVDLLWATKHGLLGIQRKEIKDLVASARDGRIAKEIGQMKSLQIAIWLVEGDWQWQRNGTSLKVNGFTRDQLRGIIFSLQWNGFWIVTCQTQDETLASVSQLQRWIEKADHHSLTRRPNPEVPWGKPENRDWGIHFWQSFEGIGPKQAAELYDHFGGLPLKWTITQEQLMAVKGIGKKRADFLFRIFQGPTLPDGRS